MVLKLLYLVTIFSVVQCGDVIYHLNDTEYMRMPAVIHREEYSDCAHYCAVDAVVLPYTNSDLYNLIVHYSNRDKTHYNHSKIRHGICVSKSCEHVHTNTSVDLRQRLEACLNQTLTKEYGLRAKVTNFVCSDDYEKMRNLDNGDMAMLAIVVALVILNTLGSLQEVIVKKEERRNKFLSCFGLQRNLDILFAERKLSDHEVEMKAIYGIRFLTMVLVVLGHMTILITFTDTGSHIREKNYEVEQYLVGGTVIVHSFFVISSYLITHSLLTIGEKTTLGPSVIPIFILRRWLRLTPAYLFIFGLTATLLRLAISNPLAQLLVGNNVSDCRRDWWMVLLYIINYNDQSQCMIEAWYISTDFYLSILGVTVVVLLQGKKRIAALIVLFCTGLLTSGVHTYTGDLDGTLQPSPENILRFLEDYPTFHWVYKRTHTNVSSYVVGIATAIIIFYMHKNGINRNDNVVLRIFCWILVPFGATHILAGVVFYLEGPRLWLAIRVVSAMFHKTIFALGIGTVIIAQHLRLGGRERYKIDLNTYGWFRTYSLKGSSWKALWLACKVVWVMFQKTIFAVGVGTVIMAQHLPLGGLLHVLRWRLWVAPARLSYCVYLVNMLVIRLYVAVFTTLPYKSTLELYAYTVIVHVACYIFSVPLWLFVEAPSVNFSKLVMNRILEKEKNETEDSNNSQVSVIAKP